MQLSGIFLYPFYFKVTQSLLTLGNTYAPTVTLSKELPARIFFSFNVQEWGKCYCLFHPKLGRWCHSGSTLNSLKLRSGSEIAWGGVQRLWFDFLIFLLLFASLWFLQNEVELTTVFNIDGVFEIGACRDIFTVQKSGAERWFKDKFMKVYFVL